MYLALQGLIQVSYIKATQEISVKNCYFSIINENIVNWPALPEFIVF